MQKCEITKFSFNSVGKRKIVDIKMTSNVFGLKTKNIMYRNPSPNSIYNYHVNSLHLNLE